MNKKKTVNGAQFSNRPKSFSSCIVNLYSIPGRSIARNQPFSKKIVTKTSRLISLSVERGSFQLLFCFRIIIRL